jgi:L-fucose isomerase-like protein
MKLQHIFCRLVMPAAAIVLGLSTSTSRAVTHGPTTVTKLQVQDDRNCLFFQLNGVTVADSAVSNTSAWFAIPRTIPQYRDMLQLLTAAKLTQ